MNARVAISVDENHARELEILLREIPNGAPTAIMRGLNKTVDWVNTATLRAITDNINVKAADLRDSPHRFGGVNKTPATMDNLVAMVSVTGSRIPLFRLGGRPTVPPTRRGISYQIDTGGGRKTIAHGAFVVHMKSGHVGFYRRAGKARFPFTKELEGPSIPHVAEHSPELRRALDIDAGEQLSVNVQRAVDFLLSKGRPGDE